MLGGPVEADYFGVHLHKFNEELLRNTVTSVFGVGNFGEIEGDAVALFFEDEKIILRALREPGQ